MTITDILLAADYSHRFGSDKLLHPLAVQNIKDFISQKYTKK